MVGKREQSKNANPQKCEYSNGHINKSNVKDNEQDAHSNKHFKSGHGDSFSHRPITQFLV